MARSATANLTATARVNDQASAGLRAISREAGQMGRGFQKSSQLIGLMGNALGETNSKVAAAAGQISGFAATIAAGGAFGIAIASATAAAHAFSAALDMIADAADRELESSDVWKRAEAIANLDKIEREHKAALKKSQDDLLGQIDAENIGRRRTVALLNEYDKKAADVDARRSAAVKQHESDVEAWFEKEFQAREDIAALDVAMDEQDRESTRARLEHEKTLHDFKQELADSELEYDRAVQDERAARFQVIADNIGDMSEALANVLIADNKRAADAARQAFIKMALDKIQAAAASGAASAAENAVEEFPYPYNLIVAAVASAAVYTAIAAFRAKVLHAATGGEVKGGTPGRDSVPSMLMPGEIVMPAPVAREFKRMAEGKQGGRGDTGPVQVSVSISALDPDSVRPEQLRRLALKLGNEIETMRGRGMVRTGRG